TGISPAKSCKHKTKGVGQHARMVGQLAQERWVNMDRNLHEIKNNTKPALRSRFDFFSKILYFSLSNISLNSILELRYLIKTK
ncbi:MAG: hypothetical protein NTW29_12340, partial [Bacteroidetes bacterium]|nr:hypothetical protein [Bacteroidota bacterium]